MDDAAQYSAHWTLGDCRSGPATRSPEPHQNAALAKLDTWYGAEGSGKGAILSLPTGGGKTFTAVRFLCTTALSDGYKVLWLAHTHHLLEQAFATFDASALRDVREPRESLTLRVVSGTPGHYRAAAIDPSDDVIVATLQTMTHAYREGLDALMAFLRGAKRKLLVVFDEAHHAPAPSYRKLLEALRSDHGATLLGLTATPTYENESKRGWLAKLFPQGVVAKSRASELIAAGVLARPHYEPHQTLVKPEFAERDYQKWLGTFGDIPEHVVAQLAERRERNELIASTYVANKERYKKTIIFADRWMQCEAIVEALGSRGVKAGAVYSHVDASLSHGQRQRRSRDENARVLQRFRSGEIDVLVNVKMLTEGTDLPDAQTVFITRQTTSRILMTQMIGRALRGPKFGGTQDAYIALFIDDWQRAINFADFGDLNGGTDDTTRPTLKRTPLELISIDLLKKLARQMDSGVNRTSEPFVALLPAGWFHVTFDSIEPGSDDVAVEDQMVLAFDEERPGFEHAISELMRVEADTLPDEATPLEEWSERLDGLRLRHLANVSRSAEDLVFDLFRIARHIGQNETAPPFFTYDARADHDLDAIAKDHAQRDLRVSEVKAALEQEYARKDRFWRVLFPRFDQFKSFYNACGERDSNAGANPAQPRRLAPPAPREASEADKKQVIRRDGEKCLACGATRKLQADHIVPVFTGGTNELTNLQTLCSSCNRLKGTRKINFTVQQTPLHVSPEALAHPEDPTDAGDREHWERFLRRTLNFTFQCAAVSSVHIGGKGERYYNWTVELMGGNLPGWIEPHLERLVDRIQETRAKAGKAPIESLTITAPGGELAAFRQPQ